jgi:hypothetical protein
MHGPGRDVRKEKREKRWSSCSLVIMASPPPAAVDMAASSPVLWYGPEVTW